MPYIFSRVNPRFLAVAFSYDLDTYHSFAFCRHQVIDSAEILGPVHSDYSHAVVEFKVGVVAECESHIVPLFLGDSEERRCCLF